MRFVRLTKVDGTVELVNPDRVAWFEHIKEDRWKLSFGSTSLEIAFPAKTGSVEGDRTALARFLQAG